MSEQNDTKVVNGITLTHEQYSAMEEMLRADKKMYAIKMVRDYTGIGLAEAKELVEQMEKDLNLVSSAPAPKEKISLLARIFGKN